MALTPFGRSNDNRVFDPFHLDSFFDYNGFPSFRSLWDPQSLPRDFSSLVGTQVDWKETSDAHVFKANLPGLRKEEVKVQVEDGRVLQISGERRRDETETTDTWHRVERSQGSFMRSFRLPENARMDEVKAAMENGVLTVTIPKVQISRSTSRSIQISG